MADAEEACEEEAFAEEADAEEEAGTEAPWAWRRLAWSLRGRGGCRRGGSIGAEESCAGKLAAVEDNVGERIDGWSMLRKGHYGHLI